MATILSIAATDGSAAETTGTTVNSGTFTITRSEDTTAALTVTYSIAGNATNGTSAADYTVLTSSASGTLYSSSLPGTVVIPAGQASVTLTIVPVNDAIAAEGSETLTLTLVDGDSYDLGAASAATVTIADNTKGLLKKVGAITSANGAEISAFDPGSDRLFVVAATTVEFYQIGNTGALTSAGVLSPGFAAPAGTEILPNSVAVKNGVVAVAYAIRETATGVQQPGKVSFYNAATGAFINAVNVGALPDMLTFTPDGTRVLVANEGEPNSYGQGNSVDPEGSISVINLAGGAASATVQTATFSAFNSQIAALRAAGVRITGPGATVAQDLEPEYIAVAPDGLTALVTLQENNAIATLDISTATITSVAPLGVKDFNVSNNGLDPSDRDRDGSVGTINIRNEPVVGLYQPDAIANFTVGGQTYYITANEGDARDYVGFSEEIRAGATGYVLDPTALPNAASLKQNANLGRLTVTNATGDSDGDGDFDRIETFGARSFSIWDGAGNRVFDSGDQIERITATQVPGIFNSDGSFAANAFDGRSDNKGAEPEGVVTGVVNNRTYAFIGLERTGDVIVYDVTNPSSPSFVEYINTPEDIGIEGLTFVSAADSPTGKSLLITTNEVSRTIAVFEFTPAFTPTNRIRDIQGASHISPLLASAAATAAVQNVPGIVTAIASNGFYLQDPTPDNNAATSEGIFVFTGANSPILAARTVGEAVLVNGTVSEFRVGGNANNLTTTQISNNNAVQSLSVTAWGTAPTTVIAPTVLNPPNQFINNDGRVNVETGGDFDPTIEGIDYYESVEGMLVQVNNPIATAPTATFGSSEEIWVLADNGVNATSRTARGGSLITATDFNPERIQIDDLINGTTTLPSVNVGARLSTITGVVSYDFNNYEVLVSAAPTVVQASPVQKEVTNLTGSANQLTVATFNVENLDPSDGAAQFNALAARIVSNLKSPDIISLEEIQDNNGATNDGVVDASVTFQTLIDAIAAAGGPRYQFRQINPVNNQDGGEPGGNIRVGFLFNPSRVEFVDRPGGGSTTNTTVTNVGGAPRLSSSPGRIVDTNPAEADTFSGDDFASSRKPLVGEFLFNGQAVFVVGNHFNSKGGDQPLFGPNQPPVLSSEQQRIQQATQVRDFVRSVLAINPNANVVVAGDLNDFEFSQPLTILEDNGNLNTLIETLPANERYTYNFQGNAQTLDHILTSDNLLSKLDGFDVVHFNSEFADQISDHDPLIARFNLAQSVVRGTNKRDRLTGTVEGDNIVGRSGADRIKTLAGRDRIIYNRVGDRGDVITDFTPGQDKLVFTTLLDRLSKRGYNGTNAIADGFVKLTRSGADTVVKIDNDGLGGKAVAQDFLTLRNVSRAAANNLDNFVFN
jgi:uncharacterized protein